MKYLQRIIFVLALLPEVGTCQVTKGVSYAPSCTDSFTVEGDILSDTFNHAEFYFYGGRPQFKRYLEVNLYPFLQKGEIPDGEVAISIHIDSTGIPNEFKIIKGINTSSTINSLIFEKIKKIRMWIPLCYYNIRQNNFLCKEGYILVDLFFKDRSVTFDRDQ